MNDFQTGARMLKEVHYVYTHNHPVTKEVVYVGRGTGSRAWMMRNSGGSTPKYGHRNASHWAWFCCLEQEGYTLADIVAVLEKGLSKSAAGELERKIIEEVQPKFNIQKGYMSMVSPDKLAEARKLRRQGLFYSNIASLMGIAPITAWRYANHAV